MKIHLLYTGGTIGCVGSPLAPLQGPAFVSAFGSLLEGMITDQNPGLTIEYDWFTTTLDSTNMQPSDWVTIARKVLDKYTECDGFVVLHGTDTMAWTASALSFLLPNISKPLIVTGSQLPLFHQTGSTYDLLYNTDALRNVLGALAYAMLGLPQVCLYFDDQLFRGNRVVKSNASQFAAFASPDFPAVAQYGVLAKVNDALLPPAPKARAIDDNLAKVKADLETISRNIQSFAVIQFQLFPAYYDAASGGSLLVSMLENILKSSPSIRGLVIEAYGEGNVPDFPKMQALLKRIHDEGVVIVDCTQVFAGDVNYNAYATGAWLKGCGVISGYDMTPIAALAKLVVLRALLPQAPVPDIEARMGRDWTGELTSYYSLSGYRNEFLSPGETLYSVNGRYQLLNDTSGTLTVFDLASSPSRVIWQKALGQAGRLVMQADCNLVFYSRDSRPLWASNTARIGSNAYVQLDDDGSLGIYDLDTDVLLWRSSGCA